MTDDSEAPENVFWQKVLVDRDEREAARGHRGAILWFTGLSASGKSTLATRLDKRLHDQGYFSFILDGDNLRHGLCKDLGFSPEDRNENIRRVGEVAKLFADAGALISTAFISPYREIRDRVRERATRDDDMVEIFVKCPVDVCAERDPKGLYEKARKGEIENFTGISAPYEEPEDPDVVVETHEHEPEECVDQIMDYLRAEGYIEREREPATASV